MPPSEQTENFLPQSCFWLSGNQLHLLHPESWVGGASKFNNTTHTKTHCVEHNTTARTSTGCWNADRCRGALLWVFTPRPLEEAEDDSQDLSREFPFQGPSKPPGSTAASKFKMPLSSNWWLMISPYIKNVCSMYYYRMSITILGQVQYAEPATKHSPSWEVSSTKIRISTNANQVLASN